MIRWWALKKLAPTLAGFQWFVVVAPTSWVGVLAPDGADKLKERFLDVDERLGASFKKLTAQFLRHFSAFVHRHLSLVYQIKFVTEEDYRYFVNLVNISHTLQLVQQRGEFLVERGTTGDGINDEESFSISDPLLSHGGVLKLLDRGIMKISEPPLVLLYPALPIPQSHHRFSLAFCRSLLLY